MRLPAMLLAVLVASACKRAPEPEPQSSETAAEPAAAAPAAATPAAATSVDPTTALLEAAAQCPYNHEARRFEQCPGKVGWDQHVRTQRSAKELKALADGLVAATHHSDSGVRTLAATELRIGQTSDPTAAARKILEQLAREADPEAAAALGRALRGVDLSQLDAEQELVPVAANSTDGDVLKVLLPPIAKAKGCESCEGLLLNLAADDRHPVRSAAIKAIGDGTITPRLCKALGELVVGERSSVVALVSLAHAGAACADQHGAAVADLERRVAAKEVIAKRFYGLRVLLKSTSLDPALRRRLQAALRKYGKTAPQRDKKLVGELVALKPGMETPAKGKPAKPKKPKKAGGR